MKKEASTAQTSTRGRPRTRAIDRSAQVSQNMRLYRARRAAELEALGKALNALERALGSDEHERLLRAAAAVCGIWSSGRLRESVDRSREKRGVKPGPGA